MMQLMSLLIRHGISVSTHTETQQTLALGLRLRFY